jgi:hypothetical protein
MGDEYKGYNGTIIITDSGVVIKRGAKGFLLGGGMLRGDKTIPYSSIIAVQYKKAGVMSGYLQLSLRGGSEAKGGVTQAIKDENTVTFQVNKSKMFWELKELIEAKMHEAHIPHQIPDSQINNLEKLADLNHKGVITDSEFAAKKKQILGL